MVLIVDIAVPLVCRKGFRLTSIGVFKLALPYISSLSYSVRIGRIYTDLFVSVLLVLLAQQMTIDGMIAVRIL